MAHNKLPFPMSQGDSWLISNEIVNPVTVNPVTLFGTLLVLTIFVFLFNLLRWENVFFMKWQAL
jgi:hypothetical protein